MKAFCILITVTCFIPYIQKGQDSLFTLKFFDYKKADSIALNFPKKKYSSFTNVAAPLCEKLKTEHEKFRVIFRWIANNIEYNKSASNVSEADKVVKNNKAVCMGFSSLLKEMCNSVGIDCDTISGYTKTEIKDIGKKLKKTDHAWNAVKLYNRWYLVDVTWATSKYNVLTRKFEKQFDEHYFLTPPEVFILDHFPQDKNWQLLKNKVKKKTFINSPVYYTDFFHFNCLQSSIKFGKFKLKKGNSVKITFSCNSNISEAGFLVNNERNLIPAPIQFDKPTNTYLIDFTPEKPGTYNITLFLNKLAALDFVINVHK